MNYQKKSRSQKHYNRRGKKFEAVGKIETSQIVKQDGLMVEKAEN